MSIYLYTYIQQSIYLSIYPYTYIQQSIYLSINLYTYIQQSIYLSLWSDFALAEAGSKAGELPDASSLTNANLRCGDGGGGGVDESTNTSSSYPCTEGSVCLDGDLGVYCQCYSQTVSYTHLTLPTICSV